MIRQFELVERVKAYDPAADEDALNRAYVFAMKAHGSQSRASGDPYFSHPLDVAEHPGAHEARQRLHRHRPAPRHGRGHRRDAASRSSSSSARRSRAWSTASPSSPASSCSRTTPSMRRISASWCWPCRRTSACCWSSSPTACTTCRRCTTSRIVDKRRRIALETLEIYAPLAERIGMQQMKDELENLAFAELYPDGQGDRSPSA